MTLKKLYEKENGICNCPVCGRPLRRVDGGAVQIVAGHVDMENTKPRYECHSCAVFYREVLTSGYYDSFPLVEGEALSSPAIQKTETATVSLDPVPLTPGQNGTRFCPQCHHSLRVVEGGAVRVVDGKVDMENTKPRYVCASCKVFYREVLTSGYYLPYSVTEAKGEDDTATRDDKPSKEKKILATGDIKPMELKRDDNGRCGCPRCGADMEYVEGGAVRLVDGKPYMDDIWDHFVCKNCTSVFRRIAGTNYFQWSEK